MPIHQTKKQSDLEKRLRLLRQQVYGKSEHQQISVSLDQKDLTDRFTEPPIHRSTETLTHQTSDITYLRQDLIKISILAIIAFAAQIILFYLLQNNLLKINIF